MTEPSTAIREAVARAAAEHAHMIRAARDEAAALAETRASLAAAETGRKILQEIAAGVQAAAHEQIARVVSKCLETVFGDAAYDFKIHFEQKRGKTEARMVLCRAGREHDPLSETGGGVCDVVAFALRLAALVLSRPISRRLLVLDEPFRMLSKDHAERVGALIEELAERMDVQIVLVTHNPALAAGVVVEIS